MSFRNLCWFVRRCPDQTHTDPCSLRPSDVAPGSTCGGREVHRTALLGVEETAAFRPTIQSYSRPNIILFYDSYYWPRFPSASRKTLGDPPSPRSTLSAAVQVCGTDPDPPRHTASSVSILLDCGICGNTPQPYPKQRRGPSWKDKIESHSQRRTILRFKRNKAFFVDNAILISLSY
jgi:hypothetical protein